MRRWVWVIWVLLVLPVHASVEEIVYLDEVNFAVSVEVGVIRLTLNAVADITVDGTLIPVEVLLPVYADSIVSVEASTPDYASESLFTPFYLLPHGAVERPPRLCEHLYPQPQDLADAAVYHEPPPAAAFLGYDIVTDSAQLPEAQRDAFAVARDNGAIVLRLRYAATDAPRTPLESVEITARADALRLPLNMLHTFTRNARLWIYADTPVTTAGAEVLTPDWAQLRAQPRILSNTAPSFDAQNPDNYQGVRYAMAQAQTDTVLLREAVGAAGGRTRTLFYTVRGAALESDPLFVIDPSPRPLIDLADYVEALIYWGCTNREAVDEILANPNLPSGRSRMFGLSVAHPPAWTHVTAQGDATRCNVQGVTSAPYAIFSGEPQRALAALAAKTQPDVPFLALTQDVVRGAVMCPHLELALDFSVLWDGYDSVATRPLPDAEGVYIRFVDPADDDAARPMYRAMLSYLKAFPYLYHDALPYTLFVDGAAGLSYPSGWREYTGADGSITLMDSANSAVRVELLRTNVPVPLRGVCTALSERFSFTASNARGWTRLAFFDGSPHIIRFSAPRDAGTAVLDTLLSIDSTLQVVPRCDG